MKIKNKWEVVDEQGRTIEEFKSKMCAYAWITKLKMSKNDNTLRVFRI